VPDYGAAFYDRGMSYNSNGDYAKALADCDAALKIDAEDADALYVRGLVKQRKGYAKGAAEDIATAVKQESGIAARFKRYGIRN
jgi:Tfp pilus assembly protein PilF